MTELLNAEFEDETGTRRRLTRQELGLYLSVVAGAGNETTTRLIGWTGKVLADHPDQRREIVEDRSLVPDAIEELLRFEPPAPHVGRYVARDAEIHGRTVPEGSAILFLVGAANRDDRRFPDGDTFDIRRKAVSHVTFGYGAHFCLGAALARLEGRIALDELLDPFPRVGGRPGRRQDRPDLDGPRVGDTADRRGLRKGHPMGSLEGKVAVITGAGSGMGKASVKVFAREGAKVVAGDISGAQDDVAKDIGDAVLPVHCDVTNEDDVAAMVRAAVDTFGRLDVMLNVAGIADGAMVADTTNDLFDRTMNVDLRGVFFGMKHAIKAMLEGGHGGSIVNWSSIGGLNATPFTSVYSAAKAGVIAATKVAAVEYGAKGIRVNAVCPGFIHTEIMGAHPEWMPGILEKAALGRGGQADEVAEVAAFLASDKASFVSGAIIPVDGGWSAKTA